LANFNAKCDSTGGNNNSLIHSGSSNCHIDYNNIDPTTEHGWGVDLQNWKVQERLAFIRNKLKIWEGCTVLPLSDLPGALRSLTKHHARSGLWIRIDLIWIRDIAFLLNPDPDPDPC
jgi:hypothetical protein